MQSIPDLKMGFGSALIFRRFTETHRVARHLGVCIGIACCPGFARIVAGGEQGRERKVVNQCESVQTMIAFCLRHDRQFVLQSDDHPKRVERTIFDLILHEIFFKVFLRSGN